MTILEQLRADYARFPTAQTYELYAQDVFFKDPMNQFYGVQRYQDMIQFIERYFVDVVMDVHALRQTQEQIDSRWTLTWTAS